MLSGIASLASGLLAMTKRPLCKGLISHFRSRACPAWGSLPSSSSEGKAGQFRIYGPPGRQVTFEENETVRKKGACRVVITPRRDVFEPRDPAPGADPPQCQV